MKRDYQDDSSFSSWYPDKPAVKVIAKTNVGLPCRPALFSDTLNISDRKIPYESMGTETLDFKGLTVLFSCDASVFNSFSLFARFP